MTGSSWRRFGSPGWMVAGISLAAAATLLLAAGFLTRRGPENEERFLPVGHGKMQFLGIYGNHSFEPMSGVPVVSTAIGESLLEKNFNAIYNQWDMRCRFQVLSGLPERAVLDEYRVLLTTSKAKKLVKLHARGATTVSEDFVCVKESGLASIPGVVQVGIADGDHLRATLVRRSLDPGQPATPPPVPSPP